MFVKTSLNINERPAACTCRLERHGTETTDQRQNCVLATDILPEEPGLESFQRLTLRSTHIRRKSPELQTLCNSSGIHVAIPSWFDNPPFRHINLLNIHNAIIVMSAKPSSETYESTSTASTPAVWDTLKTDISDCEISSHH